MKQKLFLILVSCFLFAFVANGQTQRTVTGTVRSSDMNIPISAVSVLIERTNRGTQTGINGTFSIQVQSGDKLIFKHVGYKTKEISIGTSSTLNVQLEPTGEMIEDIVVVGYGSGTEASNMVASVKTVSSKQIKDRPRANLLESLQGQVAGLTVITSSGEPSSTQSLRLRGIGSLGASSTPLYVLDGVPVGAGTILSINPEDLESVSILKDAAATSIYGARAANGVVSITSKKGRVSEKATIKYRGQYGWSNLAQTKMQENMLSGQELLDLWLAVGYRTQAQIDEIRKNNPKDFEWFRYYYKQDRPMQQHDLNISGGSEKLRYYIAGGLYKEEGLMYRSGYNRGTVRGNFDLKLNNWATMGFNIGASVDDAESNGWGSNDPNGGLSLLVPAFYSPFKEDGSEYWDERIPGWGRYAPNYLATMFPNNQKRTTLLPLGYFQINPIPGLTLKSQGGIDYFNARTTARRLPSYVLSKGNGTSSESTTISYLATWTNTLEYKFKIQEEHSIGALVGNELIDFQSNGFSGTSTGQVTDKMVLLSAGPSNRNVSQSISEYAFNSLFGQLSYDYKKKYFLNATLRQDKSSRFGRERSAATFWSFGGMWDIKSETFMNQNVNWLNDLKFRASYGTSGNAEIGNYEHLETVGAVAYGERSAWGIVSPGNPILGWEKQSMLSVGLSGTAVENLNFNVEFYDRKTVDMLMYVPYPYTTGFASRYENVGSLQNKGLEVELSYNFKFGNNGYFQPRITYGYNENKVTELFQNRDFWVVPNSGISYVVGQPVQFFTPILAGVNSETGNYEWYVPGDDPTKSYRDPNNVTSLFNPGTLQQNTGSELYAPHAGGFGFDASYHGFSISTLFIFSKGNFLTNNDRYFYENPAQFLGFNQSKTVLDYWKEPGDNTRFARFGSISQFDTGLLEDASFLRWKNLTIGYNIPSKLLGRSKFFESARVFYVGRNLWTTTKYLGADPETNSNISLGRNPNTKQSTFGLEFTF